MIHNQIKHTSLSDYLKSKPSDKKLICALVGLQSTTLKNVWNLFIIPGFVWVVCACVSVCAYLFIYISFSLEFCTENKLSLPPGGPEILLLCAGF